KNLKLKMLRRKHLRASFRASHKRVEKSLDPARDRFCFLVDFSASSRRVGTSVEMTCCLFCRAI
ncbi:MAG: hypothetical protein NTX52_01405, partial [Planctomycetota bacterium]|nr:hypothetical protein [Planctomycetota bacterium]